MILILSWRVDMKIEFRKLFGDFMPKYFLNCNAQILLSICWYFTILIIFQSNHLLLSIFVLGDFIMRYFLMEIYDYFFSQCWVLWVVGNNTVVEGSPLIIFLLHLLSILLYLCLVKYKGFWFIASAAH